MRATWRIWSARTDRRRAMRTRTPRLPSCSCVSRRPKKSRDSSPRPRSYSSGVHSSHKTWNASGTRCVGASVITLESPPAPPSPTKRGDTLRLSSPPNPPGERPLPDRAVSAPRVPRQRQGRRAVVSASAGGRRRARLLPGRMRGVLRAEPRRAHRGARGGGGGAAAARVDGGRVRGG